MYKNEIFLNSHINEYLCSTIYYNYSIDFDCKLISFFTSLFKVKCKIKLINNACVHFFVQKKKVIVNVICSIGCWGALVYIPQSKIIVNPPLALLNLAPKREKIRSTNDASFGQMSDRTKSRAPFLIIF